MAWKLEKARVAHRKLRKHFLDDLSQPRIVVHCIKRPESVAGFRRPELSDTFLRTNTTMVKSVTKLKSLASRARKSVQRRHEREEFHRRMTEEREARAAREEEERLRGLAEQEEAAADGRRHGSGRR